MVDGIYFDWLNPGPLKGTTEISSIGWSCLACGAQLITVFLWRYVAKGQEFYQIRVGILQKASWPWLASENLNGQQFPSQTRNFPEMTKQLLLSTLYKQHGWHWTPALFFWGSGVLEAAYVSSPQYKLRVLSLQGASLLDNVSQMFSLVAEKTVSRVTLPGEDSWQPVPVSPQTSPHMAFSLCWFCLASLCQNKSQLWVWHVQSYKSSQPINEPRGGLGDSNPAVIIYRGQQTSVEYTLRLDTEMHHQIPLC